MADGATRPIQEVQPGDEVLSFYGNGRFGPARVVGVHRSRATGGVAITLVSGRRLVSTPEHTHFAGFSSGRSRAAPDARPRGRAGLVTQCHKPLTATVTLCGGRLTGGEPSHRLTVSGLERAVEDGVVTRRLGDVRDMSVWLHESSYSDFSELAARLVRIDRLLAAPRITLELAVDPRTGMRSIAVP